MGIKQHVCYMHLHIALKADSTIISDTIDTKRETWSELSVHGIGWHSWVPSVNLRSGVVFNLLQLHHLNRFETKLTNLERGLQYEKMMKYYIIQVWIIIATEN